MEEASTSGLSSMKNTTEEKRTDDLIYSPQDIPAEPTALSRYSHSKRGRSKQMDAVTIPLSNDVKYSTIHFPVACDICSHVYANGASLFTHMELDHADFTPYDCSICNKPFAKLTQLQRHMGSHDSEKEFDCPICNQRFSRQDCVTVHMRIHDKSKCVHCDVCEKSFLTQGALNIHQRIHRGEKPFRCHLCGKCFTQKNHVIMHIMRHTRVNKNQDQANVKTPRMFQCEMCPRAFIRLSDFGSHMQWTHGVIATNSVAAPAQIPESPMQQQITSSRIKAFYEKLSEQQQPKKKMFCTTSTQTDNNSEHVIIPTKYQTQVALKLDEHMYENEIFDEGMDRNYSSDEDETIPFVGMTNFGTSMSAVDEAFDAVLGKQGNSSKNEEKPAEPLSEKSCPTKESICIDKSLSKRDDTAEGEINTEVSTTFVSKETSNGPDKQSTANLRKVETGDVSKLSQEAEMREKIYTRPKRNQRDYTVPQRTGDVPLPKVTERDVPLPKVSERDAPVPQITKKDVSLPKVTERDTSIPNVTEKDAPVPEITKNDVSVPKVRERVSLTSHFHDRVSPGPDNVDDNDISLLNIYNRNSEDVMLSRAVPKIKTNFDMSNWRSKTRKKYEKGRGRGKNKVIMGLRGASHLRLMRKSLINYISERNEASDEEMEIDNETEAEQFADATPEKLGKRQTKTKQHGEDFLCSSKSCEICQPSVAKLTVQSGETPAVKPEKKVVKVKKELPLGQYQDNSNKLLKFIFSGDSTSLEGTDFKLLSEVESEQRDEFHGYRKSLKHEFSPEETPVESKSDPPDDIPVVNFDSICIPTFSCKLCGREFRFEGKLHRHIESAHQKKVIYSPDVRPGGKKFKMDDETEYFNEPVQKKSSLVNPELAALRSEWDDEEEDILEKRMAVDVVRPQSLFRSIMNRQLTLSNKKNTASMQKHRVQRIYSSNSYPQGVKLNFNKFSGSQRHEGHSHLKVKTEVKPILPKSVSLETKCSKLLEKLFKMGLLMKCGHKEDHVSTVLGKVLQHYGVKMIEDYGQGQYEVLKYNLWRLIEWKVTMEQMEEFYTQGKSVEEMMDDIMNNRVPITAHTEPGEKKISESEPAPTSINLDAPIMDTLPIGEQLVISQVALDGNVTQLMLAQDVSPEMLQGARIVTLDPNTGQVISQVTADEVILAGSVSEELSRHIESIEKEMVSNSPSSSTTTIVSSLPPGSIVPTDEAIHIGSTTIDGELVVTLDPMSETDASSK